MALEGLKNHLKTAFLGAALAASPALATAETLTDALIAAYRHSHLLDQNRAVLRAADEDVAQAVAELRPVIAFVGSATLTPRQGGAANTDAFTSSFGLEATLTLYDSGARQLALDALKETVLATREGLKAVEQNVLLGAVRAYLDVIQSSETVSLRGNNVRVITQELRAAKDRFEVGEVTRTDVALAEARLAAARSAEAAAMGELAVARESYRQAVGRYPGALQPTPRAPSLPKTLKEAEAVAVRTHPDIRQAQRQVTIAEIGIKRSETGLKARVTGTANYGLNEDFSDSLSLRAQLRQPIYSGGALQSAVRGAKANHDAQRAALLNTTHLVRQTVGNSWANLAVSRAQIEATDRQIRASSIAFRGVQEEAKLGSRTTLEVLNAEQELLSARADRIEAQSQQYLAIYSLLASMGLLTVEHLQLGIQTYDPAAYYNAVKNAPIRRSKEGKKLDKVLERLGRN